MRGREGVLGECGTRLRKGGGCGCGWGGVGIGVLGWVGLEGFDIFFGKIKSSL